MILKEDGGVEGANGALVGLVLSMDNRKYDAQSRIFEDMICEDDLDSEVPYDCRFVDGWNSFVGA